MRTKKLQQKTRDYFDTLPTAIVKHFGDGKFGLCVVQDGTFVITDLQEGSDTRWVYETIEAMLMDGWVVD